MSEKELDINDLIRDFNEYSTDYTKTACRYYEDYLINYQKEKLDLQQENQKLTHIIEELEKWLREQHEKVWDKVAEEMLIDTLFKLKQLQEESK